MSIPVTIHGTGFKGIGFETGPTSVHIGTEDGPTNVTDIVVVSDALITCKLPSRDPAWPHKVSIWVTTPHGTGFHKDVYDYSPPHPFIVTSITPPYGIPAGDEPIVIRGDGFLGADGSGLIPAVAADFLRFSSVSPLASFAVISDTEIHARTPAGVYGQSWALRVRTEAAVAFLGDPGAMDAFVYAVPSLFAANMAPNSGSWNGGQTVVMSRGPGQPPFSELLTAFVVQDVTEYAISFTVVNDNVISFTMPNAVTAGCSPAASCTDPGFAGLGRVVIRFKDAGSVVRVKGFFTYEIFQILSVTDPVPSAGGSTVSVVGTGLDMADYAEVEDFLGVIALTVVTGSLVIDDEHHAHFTAPAAGGIVTGTVFMSSVLGGGQDSSKNFTYFSGLEPVIVSSTPADGDLLASTTIVIAGSNFAIAGDGSDDVTEVRLSRDGVFIYPVFTVDSDTQITAIVPPGYPTWGGRQYVIRLTSPHGATSTPDPGDPHFRYRGTPVVVGYTPTTGSAAGGTVLLIQVDDSSVCIAAECGGVPMTAFTIVDATHVSAATGPHAPGAVDVHVANANGMSSAGAGFTYV